MQSIKVQGDRLASIEAIRFVFMLVIILWHFSRFNPFTHGYVVVDFFFMLSGFFLFKSYKKNQRNAFAYTVDKVKKFAPEYVLMFFVVFLVKSIIVYKDESVNVLCTAIPELLMIQGVGFNTVINTPTWYISVMLIAGCLIYALLKVKILSEILLPILVISIYVYLFHRSPSIETFEKVGLLYLPLLRGFAGMGYGVMISILSIRYNLVLELKYKYVNIFTVLAIAIVLIDLFLPWSFDKYAILSFSMIILSCSISKSFLNVYLSSPIWNKLGGITYEMLLSHAFIIGVIAKLIRGYYMSLPVSITAALLYVCIVLLCSSLLKRFAEVVQQRILNKN